MFSSSDVNLLLSITSKKQCGPGDDSPKHLESSSFSASSESVVSNSPGVSTTWIVLPNFCVYASEHFDVTDAGDFLDPKCFALSMVFPVALLPLPVFPRSTRRSSLSIPFSWRGTFCFLCPPTVSKKKIIKSKKRSINYGCIFE